MDNANCALDINSISFHYKNESPLLVNVNLSVRKGRVVGLLGQNGAGKSTLLKIIVGIIKPQSGSILFWGNEAFSAEQLNHIGYSIGEPSGYPYMTILDHLKMMDLIFHKGSYWIDYIISQTGLKECYNKRYSQLSTGMKQRLAIAVALYRDPELILLDEPMNGLDPTGIFQIRELLLNLNAQGKTIILSSHIISEIEKTCQDYAILHNGRIAYDTNFTVSSRPLEDIYLNIVQ